jgi:hypothetical protein
MDHRKFNVAVVAERSGAVPECTRRKVLTWELFMLVIFVANLRVLVNLATGFHQDSGCDFF